jgi:hypothetical protein
MDSEQVERKLRSRKIEVEQNSAKIEQIVDQLVSKYNRDLDDFMNKVKDLLSEADRKGSEISTTDIENITLRVPLYMYFAANGLETLGIQGDNAKAARMEVFNEIYLDASGTIQDKTHTAEQETFAEYLLEIAFTRAYKKLKTKLEMAEQMCQASRKVLQKRISEMDITRLTPNYEKENTSLRGEE